MAKIALIPAGIRAILAIIVFRAARVGRRLMAGRQVEVAAISVHSLCMSEKFRYLCSHGSVSAAKDRTYFRFQDMLNRKKEKDFPARRSQLGIAAEGCGRWPSTPDSSATSAPGCL